MSNREYPHYCIAPWVHLAVRQNGNLRTCCWASQNLQDEAGNSFNLNQGSFLEYWRSPAMQRIREKFLEGKPVNGCERCVERERVGHVSLRQRLQQRYAAYLDRSQSTDIEAPISLDVRAGNLCNQKCVSCHPMNSSLWEREVNKHGIENFSLHIQEHAPLAKSSSGWSASTSFHKDIEKIRNGLVDIYLTNGEPTISKDYTELLRSLAASGRAQDILVRVHTNAGHFNPAFYAELVKFNATVMLSIDGTGIQHEYLRYPSKFAAIESTIKKIAAIRTERVRLEVTPTPSILNIFNLGDIFEWRWKFLVPILGYRVRVWLHNILTEPHNMQIRHLPDRTKALAQDYLKEIESLAFGLEVKGLRAIGKIMEQSRDSRAYEQLLSELTHLDSIRNTNFRSTLPHLLESEPNQTLNSNVDLANY